MFTNFIYLIIVLLIFTAYQPSEQTNFSSIHTLALFSGLIICFTSLVWLRFQSLEKKITEQIQNDLDYKLNSTINRLSITAIIFFTIDIYVLSLPLFSKNISLFKIIPTFHTLFFIGLFLLYLTIVWGFAFRSYQKLNMDSISRHEYILSNISFSVPLLIPWFLLSVISDIINALPFELPKYLISTTQGELIYFMFFLFGIAIIGPAIIQKSWRCKPLESGYHRNRIEYLCQKAGVGYADILEWPLFRGKMITAGVMGIVKKFRYILVTKALLRFLEPEEIDAVIAHEIGHIKKKHFLIYLLFFAGYLLFLYAGFDLTIYLIVYSDSLFRLADITGFDQTTVYSTISSLVTIIIFVVYFRFVFGFFMRNLERQADIHVYTICENAKPLISSLEKIASISGQSPEKRNWHHFSIKKRIDYLKKCEADKKWITIHNQKIKKSLAVYLAGIVLIAGIGYKLNSGESRKNLSRYFFEKTILKDLQQTPDNASLYDNLGDLFYSGKNFAEAIKAYEQSLILRPDNPKVLNNLAWLLVTCGDKKFQDPKRAVILAKKASDLKESPYLLDTLAESFYADNQLENAIAVAKKALELTKENHSYYKKQLNKFIKTAEK